LVSVAAAHRSLPWWTTGNGSRTASIRPFDEVELETGRGDELAEHLAEGRRRSGVPLASWGMPRRLACNLVATVYPRIGEALSAADTGEGYMAIVVAFVGVTVFTLPPVDDPGN
jgi:hypothetical protein